MKPQRLQWWDPRTWIAFAYWELKTIFAAISDDGGSDWKATTILLALELLAMAALTDALSVMLGHKLLYRSSPYLYVVPGILILLNLKAVLGKNERWNRLSTEFETYPASVRIGGRVTIVLVAILTVIAAAHFREAQRHLSP